MKQIKRQRSSRKIWLVLTDPVLWVLLSIYWQVLLNLLNNTVITWSWWAIIRTATDHREQQTDSQETGTFWLPPWRVPSWDKHPALGQTPRWTRAAPWRGGRIWARPLSSGPPPRVSRERRGRKKAWKLQQEIKSEKAFLRPQGPSGGYPLSLHRLMNASDP